MSAIKILGIETATAACSVAIKIAEQTWMDIQVAPQQQSKLILQMCEQLLQQVNINLADIDIFAFGKGPGSFTGLRIAASVIQGLAFATNKPIVGVSTLQALAQQAYELTKTPRVLALLDARMQEVYCGGYSIASNGIMQAEYPDCVQCPKQITYTAIDVCLAVGEGVRTYQQFLQQQWPGMNITTDILYPRAEEVVNLAAINMQQGNVLTPSQAVPVYLRNQVV